MKFNLDTGQRIINLRKDGLNATQQLAISKGQTQTLDLTLGCLSSDNGCSSDADCCSGLTCQANTNPCPRTLIGSCPTRTCQNPPSITSNSQTPISNLLICYLSPNWVSSCRTQLCRPSGSFVALPSASGSCCSGKALRVGNFFWWVCQ